MATATLPKRMTIDKFLALPDDGVDRELINGEVREKGITVRNELHRVTMASIARHIGNWAASATDRKYRVLCGEAGFILDRDPQLVVGIDVALQIVLSPPSQISRTTLVDGVPFVAIEILSPSDSHGDVHEKLRLYLDHGVAVVWIVDPDDQSVRIYRLGQAVTLFSGDQILTCEPEMSGFAVNTSALFQ